jgi:hypothetical protein
MVRAATVAAVSRPFLFAVQSTMTSEEAYNHCRKHAYHHRWTPQRLYDWEDVANDAWIRWIEHQKTHAYIHPFKHVEQAMQYWWTAARAIKRDIFNTGPLDHPSIIHDDPSGQAIVNETLSLTLETMMRTTRDHKGAVEHVASLLLEGYMPTEIMAENDYEYAFLNGIRAKMASSFPDDMGKLVRFKHRIKDKKERADRRRHQIKMSARKTRAEAAGTALAYVDLLYKP